MSFSVCDATTSPLLIEQNGFDARCPQIDADIHTTSLKRAPRLSVARTEILVAVLVTPGAVA